MSFREVFADALAEGHSIIRRGGRAGTMVIGNGGGLAYHPLPQIDLGFSLHKPGVELPPWEEWEELAHTLVGTFARIEGVVKAPDMESYEFSSFGTDGGMVFDFSRIESAERAALRLGLPRFPLENAVSWRSAHEQTPEYALPHNLRIPRLFKSPDLTVCVVRKPFLRLVTER